MNLFEATFLHTGLAKLDLDGDLLLANRAMEKMLGYSSAELGSMTLFDITHPEDVVAERTRFAEVVAGQVPFYEVEKRYQSAEGAVVWGKSTLSFMKEPPSSEPYLLLAVTDITGYRSAEADLRAELGSYEELWQAASSAIVILKPDGEVVRAYPGFTRLFGYSEQEAVGRSIGDLIGPGDLHEEVSSNLELALAGQTINTESVRRHKQGGLIDVSILGRSFQRSANELGIFVLYRDISDRKQAEALIQRLSTTDELTGLWNRRGFYTLAQQELKRAEREKAGLILLYLDLDDFKRINDRYGHAEGDRALAQVAHRLRDSCRGSDTIARIGGDEFVVLAAGNEQGERILADRIRNSLATLNQRSKLPYSLALSIGSVYFHPDEENFDFDEVLSLADRRMYEQKHRLSLASRSVEAR
jgi:diguanylate cyclase (GGDEF)-like protein/PAS domain S-box-containing protein